MSGVFSGKLKGKNISTAIIGGGSTGGVLAAFLCALGFGPITIFEASEELFDERCTTLNSVGQIHHLLYGGNPDFMSYLFKAGMLFRELLPKHVFSDSKMNYLVPATTPEGDVNSAINGTVKLQGTCPPQYILNPSISLEANLQLLQKLYQSYVSETGQQIYGHPSEFAFPLKNKDLAMLFGDNTPHGREGRWLYDNGPDNGFVSSFRVKQSILNPVKYSLHMSELLSGLAANTDLNILTGKEVLSVITEGKKYRLEVRGGEQPYYFDNVINAGYADGLFLNQPNKTDSEFNVALKAFGLYELPAEMLDTFESFSMVRGWFGGVTRIGSNLVSISSGGMYDRQSQLYKPGQDSSEIKKWKNGGEVFLGASEEKLLKDIQSDISKWVPIVQTLKPVALRYAPHIYPSARYGADVISAAGRNTSNIYDHHFNQKYGQYFRLLGAKQTVVILAAIEAVHSLLKPLIENGSIKKEEIIEHLSVTSSGFIKTSDQLLNVLGKSAKEPDAEVTKKFMLSRSLPLGYL